MTNDALHCPACTLALPLDTPPATVVPCPRCGTSLHHRRPYAIARSAAFALAGLLMLVPANILPVLSTNLLGQARTDTIFSGVMSLYHDGMWAIAVIVFTASIVVPVLKLVSLGILLWAVQVRAVSHRRALTKLYSFVKFIGRWSMLDVFLVAFLTGAVQFGALASVQPEPGVIAFAAAVVLTIFATETFDPRLLWDTDAGPSDPS